MGFYLVLLSILIIVKCPCCLLKPSDQKTSEFVEKETDSANLDQISSVFIFPGTKWCGPGNTADGYNDLGEHKETDKCCRQHDHCSEVIHAGETKHNLTNYSFVTRLPCSCDEELRRCLRTVNSSTSLTVGGTYFNVIGTKCYRKDYPVNGCKTRGGLLGTKCVEYIFDTNGQKIYQWFDVPNF